MYVVCICVCVYVVCVRAYACERGASCVAGYSGSFRPRKGMPARASQPSNRTWPGPGPGPASAVTGPAPCGEAPAGLRRPRGPWAVPRFRAETRLVSVSSPCPCPAPPQGRPRGARRRQPVADGSVFQDRPFRGGGKNWLPEMSWSGLDSPVFPLRGTGGLPVSGRAAPLHLRPGAFVKDGLGEGRDPRVRAPRPFRGVLAVVASMFITLTVSLAPSRTGTRLSASWARFRPRSPGLTRKDRLRHGLPGGSAVRG